MEAKTWQLHVWRPGFRSRNFSADRTSTRQTVCWRGQCRSWRYRDVRLYSFHHICVGFASDRRTTDRASTSIGTGYLRELPTRSEERIASNILADQLTRLEKSLIGIPLRRSQPQAESICSLTQASIAPVAAHRLRKRRQA